MDSKIKRLGEKIAQAQLGGGEKRIESQHAKGKLTARERVHFLMDELHIRYIKTQFLLVVNGR